jgi:nitrate reductase assembly molybdenum cofactor insertion protein NarJ
MFQCHAVAGIAADRLLEQRHGFRSASIHEMRHGEKTKRIRITWRALQNLPAQKLSARYVPIFETLPRLL